jgi:hypothetical protein
MPIGVFAVRSGGFGGEIKLTAENLPPGVTCPPVTLSFGNSAMLLLIADEKAPASVSAIRIVGTATTASSTGPVSHAARFGSVVWGVSNAEIEPFRSRVSQEMVVAVSSGEVEPISLRPAMEKAWEQSVAGVIDVPLKVTRRPPFAGAVKVKPAAGIASIQALPEFEIAANSTDGNLKLDIGALALPAGNYSLFLQATSAGPYDRDPAKRAVAQAAKDAADKATAELATAVTKATEALTAAKTGNKKPEEIAAAEKGLAAAQEKVKQNDASKTALAAQITALAPKETTAYVYSPPIALKIAPAPITLAPPAAPAPFKAGAKVQVPVNVTRLFGFADPVDISVTIPQGVAGLSIPAINIAKDAASGTLTIQAAADAKPGDYTLTLSASLKQNNRPLKIEVPLTIKLTPP